MSRNRAAQNVNSQSTAASPLPASRESGTTEEQVSESTPLISRHVSGTRPNGWSLGSRTLAAGKWVQWFLLDQWFLIVLAILIAISSQFQVPEPLQELKRQVATFLAISVIFFITGKIGCTLPTRTLIDNYSKWQLHLFVQAQCFLVTSATVFAVVSVCAMNSNFMDPWLLIGLIFLGCVPTTISSNVIMTAQAHGNEALTVAFATIGNILGPAVSPILISMYTSTGAWYTDVLPPNSGSYGEIYLRVFRRLGLSLFLPMLMGQVVQYMFPKATEKVFLDWKLSKLSTLALLAVLWQTYDQAFQTGAFSSIKYDNLIFIIFISIAFVVLWLAVAFLTSIFWLSKEDTISVAYCVSAKTPVMGLPLSQVLYLGLTEMDESKLQIPMVIFQGFQVGMGSLLTVALRRWIAKEAKRPEQDSSESVDEL